MVRAKHKKRKPQKKRKHPRDVNFSIMDWERSTAGMVFRVIEGSPKGVTGKQIVRVTGLALHAVRARCKELAEGGYVRKTEKRWKAISS